MREQRAERAPAELRADVARGEHDEHQAPEAAHDLDAEALHPVRAQLAQRLAHGLLPARL